MKGKQETKKERNGSLADEWRLMRYVWGVAKGNHLRLVIPLLLQIVAGLFPASVTYYVQAWITGSQDIGGILTPRNILMLLGAILGVTVLKQLSTYMQGCAMADVRRTVEQKYVDYLSVRQGVRRQGEINANALGHRSVMAFSRESEMLTGLIPMVYRSFIQAPLTVLSFIVLMAMLSWRLTTVMVVIVAMVVYCCVLLRNTVKRTRRRLYGRMSDLYQIFSDWLKGERVLKFYDSGRLICGRLRGVVDDSCTLSKRLVGISCVQGIAVELLTYAGVLGFVLVVAQAQKGDSWRILLTYPLAIMYIRSEAIKVVQGYSQLTSTESSISNLTRLLDRSAARLAQPCWKERIDSVELRDVDFRYQDAREAVMHGASALFRRGDLNVIAGDSGSGKSTCLDIISMALSPEKGSVLLNGKDAAAFNPQTVADRMAMVEQEPYMFEGSFMENISFGKAIRPELIVEKCRELRLEHIISCAADLDRNVDDDGHNLSVGEKQRFAFLRAVLKRPDVLLMDEATSSVDSVSAQVMMDFVKANAEDMLVICVTHDPAVQAMADNLVNLSEGVFTVKQNPNGQDRT